MYSKLKHMLRLLLVKKYLLILLVLLLTSVSHVKANTCLYSLFPDQIIENSIHELDQLNVIEKKDPSFYPNPVRDIIKLTHQENVSRIRVISLTGKTLVDLEKPTKSIDLSHLSKGMYLINFDMKDGKRVARKLVKK